MSLEANLKPPFLPAPHWPAACLWNKSTEEVRKQTAVESILQPCLSLAEGVPYSQPAPALTGMDFKEKRDDNNPSEGALRDGSVCGQGFHKTGGLDCFNYKGWGE